MDAYLLFEPVGDRSRDDREVGRVEDARSRQVDPHLVSDATRPARENEHPIAEANRFSGVVRD